MLKLLASYRKGPMSSTTWCWRYAEKRTLRKLRSEYRRLKNQDTLMSLDDFDRRPDVVYDQKRTGAYAHIQRADEVEQIRALAGNYAWLVDDIISGDSYEEISRRRNISKMGITRALRRLGDAFRKLGRSPLAKNRHAI